MLTITIDDGKSQYVLTWDTKTLDIMELGKKISDLCREEIVKQDGAYIDLADWKFPES
jgi:hypothetical protein